MASDYSDKELIETLFYRASGQFDTTQYFCYFRNQDITLNVECSHGFLPNFDLYGGTEETTDTITLCGYGYSGPGGYAGNLFLQNDVNEPNFRQDSSINVYIPGIASSCTIILPK